jgi:hypothetical protein
MTLKWNHFEEEITMRDLPDRFLFMKVGNHAGETWEQILARKQKEFEKAGVIFWGYGGNSCHPISQVQPFARLAVKEQGSILLVMEPIDSHADPDIVPATEFSRDGVLWERIPEGINVLGSRYAFVLGEIRPGELEIALNSLEVGIGPSSGRAAEAYLQGRTDKGCLVRSKAARTVAIPDEKRVRKGEYTAEMRDPFAVLLR